MQFVTMESLEKLVLKSAYIFVRDGMQNQLGYCKIAQDLCAGCAHGQRSILVPRQAARELRESAEIAFQERFLVESVTNWFPSIAAPREGGQISCASCPKSHRRNKQCGSAGGQAASMDLYLRFLLRLSHDACEVSKAIASKRPSGQLCPRCCSSRAV